MDSRKMSNFYCLPGRAGGTPVCSSNGSGAAVWSTAYQPYGTTGTINAAINQNLRFPGQNFDAESSFNYNLNRDYVPYLGRYLESDPIGLAGGMNTYQYVRANPLNRTDRLGLEGDIAETIDKAQSVLGIQDNAGILMFLESIGSGQGLQQALTNGIQAQTICDSSGKKIPSTVQATSQAQELASIFDRSNHGYIPPNAANSLTINNEPDRFTDPPLIVRIGTWLGFYSPPSQ